jgi:nucleotide-binding universal stress UspA family protein
MLNQTVDKTPAPASPVGTSQPVKTVLLATDGTSSASHALQSAIEAAIGLNSRLVITYFADPNDVALYDGFPCLDQAEWRAYGEHVLKELAAQARAAGVSEVETFLEPYQGEELLSEIARRENASLIILGSHLF